MVRQLFICSLVLDGEWGCWSLEGEVRSRPLSFSAGMWTSVETWRLQIRARVSSNVWMATSNGIHGLLSIYTKVWNPTATWEASSKHWCRLKRWNWFVPVLCIISSDTSHSSRNSADPFFFENSDPILLWQRKQKNKDGCSSKKQGWMKNSFAVGSLGCVCDRRRSSLTAGLAWPGFVGFQHQGSETQRALPLSSSTKRASVVSSSMEATADNSHPSTALSTLTPTRLTALSLSLP